MSDARPGPWRDEAVEAAAAEWLVRHDRGMSARQQDDFLQWISASPANRESFERHRRMWGDFDYLAEWRPEHSELPNPDLLARRRPRKLMRWLLPSVLATAACFIVAGWWLNGLGASTSQTVAYEAIAYRQEKLSDGSVMDLNGGTHVMVQFSRGERRVVLVQGEAQFAVAKNPARPFVVRVGGVDVRAVGTAFNVKLAGANVEVLVTEGKVQVSQRALVPAVSPPGSSSHSIDNAAPPVLLAAIGAGERSVIPVTPVATAPKVEPVTTGEIEQLLEWRPKLLDFDSTPLVDVIAVFNYHDSTRLVLGDESLRSMPIVASIRSDNVEGFVRLLEGTMGVKAERQPNGEIVLYRAK